MVFLYMNENKINSIIRSYASLIIRLYCKIRFQILHQRFLDEIGQYIPDKGRVLDCGCGFGLFSLYFALTKKHTLFFGFDLNSNRIAQANLAKSKLGISNVEYSVRNATEFVSLEKFDAVYMLDIIHHIDPSSVDILLKEIFKSLSPCGILIIKDVKNTPWLKCAFTYVLDKLMDYRADVNYWSKEKLFLVLQQQGFNKLYFHEMVDFLPYPHILILAHKPTE